MKQAFLSIYAVLPLMFAAFTQHAFAQQPPRTDKVFVVLAPRAVTLDGDLKEWDLSGATESIYQPALAPRYTVRLAFMHDRDAFYIGAHFVDDSPLLNRHDPHVETNLGWAGDCLQVRLSSDAALGYPLKASEFDKDTPLAKSERIVHLTMWFYTDRQEPVLQIQYGMDYHGTKLLTGKAAGVAFRKEGDGYNVEARVPWALLNAQTNPPKAGDTIALVAQPLWGDAEGLKHAVSFTDIVSGPGFPFQNAAVWGRGELLAKGNLAPSQRPLAPGQISEPLQLALPSPDVQATSLSAALFTANGELVRTLPSRSLTTRDSALPIRWDGLDDDGKPLPPGAYSVKFLTHRSIGQKYVTALHNAGNPPWRTDNGRGAWGGDHGPPVAAASDGERVYLGWGFSEAGKSVIAVDPLLPLSNGQSGRRSVGVAERIGRKFWGVESVLEVGIITQALASDGERVFVAQDGRRYGDKKSDDPNFAAVVLWDAKTGRAVNFPFNKRALILSEWKTPAEGPKKGAMNLRGIAVSGERLYATLFQDDKVVAYNWRTGEKLREFAVPSPFGIAVEGSGRVLVTSEKKLLRLVPHSGAMQTLAQGFDEPRGVAVRDGKVFVIDASAVNQVKIFDAGGKYIRAIGKAGGRRAVGKYDPNGLFNPLGVTVDGRGQIWVAESDDSPRRISVWRQDGRLLGDLLGPGAYAVEGRAALHHPSWIVTHNTLFDVDYQTGKSRTIATLVRSQPGQFSVDGNMGRSLRFAHANGRTYLIWPGGISMIYRLDGDFVARPVAAIGGLKDVALYGITREMLPAKERDEAWKNRGNYSMTWTDRNADTKISPDEIALAKVHLQDFYWGAWTDENLTIWSAANGSGHVWRVPVKAWLPNGVPVYPAPDEIKPYFMGPNQQLHSAMPAHDGQGVYLLEQRGGSIQSGGGEWNAISRYGRDGRRLWSYRKTWTGFALAAPLFQPGYVIGAMKFIGGAKLGSGVELLGVNGYFGQFNLLTGDGLWLTALSKDNRYGPQADANTVWPENFSGHFYRHRDNGKCYLIAGDTDTRVWEITGLDTIKTAQAPVTLSEADVARAREALGQRSGPAAGATLTLRRLTPKIDGDLTEWTLPAAPQIDAGAGRTAKIALAYDEKNIYAAFEVQDDSPFKNSGTDAALLFKTGDVAEVFIGAAGARTTPQAGDTRFVFALLNGEPGAVLLQPLAGAGQQKAPRLFGSPTGAENFERVLQLKDAQVVVTRTAGSYRLEASVPLNSIPLALQAGQALRADAGVIFSDPGGSRNALRADVFNKDTSITNDIPSEARLQPGNWGTVRAE